MTLGQVWANYQLHAAAKGIHATLQMLASLKEKVTKQRHIILCMSIENKNFTLTSSFSLQINVFYFIIFSVFFFLKK